MSSFLAPGLSPREASHICMNLCQAMCCRGPLVLELAANEVENLITQSRRLQVHIQVNVGADGKGWLKFADHPGEMCPMLDAKTFACRIYDSRPRRCREFPTRRTPGCAISGG
jgi:Fe-S-cluster containining protein